MNENTSHHHAEPFLILLLALSFAALLWLVEPFLPALIISILLAVSTFSLYHKVRQHYTDNQSAAMITLLVASVIIFPIVILLVLTGIKGGELATLANQWLSKLDPIIIDEILNKVSQRFSISAEYLQQTKSLILENAPILAVSAQKWLFHLFGVLANNITSFILSTLVILFSLLFFYRDGKQLLRTITVISPLENHLEEIIISKFAALASILTWSTLGIALLQGLSISLISLFLDLPWFYLGLMVAVTSFIPVVGSMVVWLPTTVYLYFDGSTSAAIFMFFWGSIVMGVMIDNVARPAILGWLSRMQPASSNIDLSVVNHTLLTVLAISGGVIKFGILGLFFGPLIAAAAVTMLEVYKIKQGELLDRS